MPISLSAKKSLRKSIKNRKRNDNLTRKTKIEIKKFLAKPSQEGLSLVFSVVDKAVKNNIFHLNKAKRLKARFSRKVESLKPAKPAKKMA
ncbi:MAG: 30S ribosomal protein S20 [Candidatus Shapirobacteria bacterium]|jgi:ribosomal protein S20